MKANRRGFTLTELMIVIGILLTLATISLAVYNTGRSSDRMRSACRVAQSAILGAKDRAMHAKNFRGVRLTRDANGPTFSSTNAFPALATGFVYLQPLPLQTAGNTSTSPSAATVQISDPSAPTTTTNNVLVTIAASQGAPFSTQDIAGLWPRSGMQVRIPSASSSTSQGSWYQLSVNPNAANGSYWTGFDSLGNVTLYLQTPIGTTPVPNTSPQASLDIQLGSDVLQFHEPIALPSGAVIDFRYCSSNVLVLAGGTLTSTTGLTPPNIDFNFSPRGNVSGATGGLGAFYFAIRDLEDATKGLDPSNAAVRGECLVLALNPQTGLVQTYDADLTDANADGIVDNLFTFAQRGKAAGR